MQHGFRSQWARLRDRGVDELLGIVKGVIADDRVSDLEAAALKVWLDDNPLVVEEWPIRVLAPRLQRIFADDVVTPEERADLKQLLRDIAGEAPEAAGVMMNPTRLPFTEPPPFLEYTGRCFVLTGTFLFGLRPQCERAIREMGGLCEPRVTKRTSYLVVGALGTEAWLHSTHGRKILKAVEYVERGLPVRIVSEEHWSSSLC